MEPVLTRFFTSTSITRLLNDYEANILTLSISRLQETASCNMSSISGVGLRPVSVTYLISLLYNIIFYLQIFTMPRYLRSLGLSDAENGYVQTIFALLQLCGGPLFGLISQTHGIRFSLFITYICTALSGVLLTLSYDFPTVLLSRIPCVFMVGQQGHQTLLTALTSAGQERTNAFGRMGLINGLGVIVTPICSIVVSMMFSENASIIASAVLCVLPFFVLERYLDMESHQKTRCATDSEAKLCLSDAIGIINRPGVLNILFKKCAALIPATFLFSVLQLYLIDEFQVDVKTGQLIQMLTGISLMFSSGFGVIWMRKRFTEEALLLAGMMAFTVAFSLFFFFYRLWFIVIILPFVCFGMSLVTTAADSLLTSLVSENEQALMLAVATTIHSMIRTFAPAVSGLLLERFGFAIFPLLGSLSTALGHAAILFFPVQKSPVKKNV
ncbi:hypothetical protein Y032_0481g2263 [Ancylostoma ceylanicum]|uniref:Major facilitator superfamily (MFS) profile domain-containing protein n=1 Tax=Ancylostoma ceylanicum TaxID=53326 RepID=A0A016WVT2_9BILA|nr:hypothetical protein Y032_0481g2263 [Ancylostoma ceylanicum]